MPAPGLETMMSEKTKFFFLGILVTLNVVALFEAYLPDSDHINVNVSDKALLKQWQYTNSKRYRLGLELNKRHIHARFEAPPNVKVDGHIEVLLRGVTYSFDYWHSDENPRWTD